MKIQIFYFEGCPNHRPAVELVDDVVAAFDANASIEEIEVEDSEDAVRFRFLGSPTILVDGVDVDPSARGRTDFGFSCRTYNGAGLPSRDMVVAAVNGEATGQRGVGSETSGFGQWVLGGSVIAAIVASACCWLPLLLIAFGVSAGGFGTVFEQTRPIFLVAAFLLLALGFYVTYGRKEHCAPGSACEIRSSRFKRANRIVFWIAAIGVAAFAFFPKYAGVFQASEAGATTDASTIAGTLVTFNVDGMSCEGCSISVHNELLKVGGVLNAEVQFENGRALITVDSSSPPLNKSLVAAIERAGYQGSSTERETDIDPKNGPTP